MNLHTPQRRLNTRDAAAYLGVKPGTLEVWRSIGRGPRYMKLGTRVLYEIADLDTYAAAKVVETVETIEITKGGHRG